MPVAFNPLIFRNHSLNVRISHHSSSRLRDAAPYPAAERPARLEAAARHQNFTRAALELCVSQAALSHQIRGLEDRLGIRLFHRLPRGVALTDEGAALYPVLNESFERISASIARYTGGPAREVLTLGVVGTFATGWLLPRLAAFEARTGHRAAPADPQQPHRSGRRRAGPGDPLR
jgi:hypothetical protein